jgi:molybdenum cofactor synthesis domain-containing protein
VSVSPDSPRARDVAPTAAALVIGNELLSGKVAEANVQSLARALRELGIELRRVVMIADDIDVIADEVRALAASHDWLFTSGGVGPTHDDVTVEGVAKAFGVPVVESPVLAAMLKEHYRERCTEGHLRMALVPAGASLEVSTEVRWPTIRYRNAWLLPGVPEIFQLKLPVAIAEIRRTTSARAFVSRAVYTKMDEGDLKPLLDAVVERFPDVEVGSYPKWQEPSYKTKITFDGRDVAQVDAARDAFLALLPTGEPQRTE